MHQINLYICSTRKQRQCKHNNTCTYPVNAKQTIIITPFKNNNNGKKSEEGNHNQTCSIEPKESSAKAELSMTRTCRPWPSNTGHTLKHNMKGSKKQSNI